MSNLNKHGKFTRRRIATGVIGVGLLAVAIVFLPGACGDDDQVAKSPETTYPTTSEWMTYPTPQPTCEEQGLLRDPERSGISDRRNCTTQSELDARNDWRREHNDALAAANAELVDTVQNSGDQLVTLMNEFCRSPWRSEGPQRLVNEPYQPLVSHFDQAERLWETYWFSNNLWTATYNFSGAVSRICGDQPTIMDYPNSTPNFGNHYNPRSIPMWKQNGYSSEAECNTQEPSYMC